MNIVLCEYAEKREFTAGNKARVDVVNILKKNNYYHIPLFCSKSSKLKIVFQLIASLLKTIFYARKDDTVVIQYPYNPHFVSSILLKILHFGGKLRGFRTTMLVHDINALRSFPIVEDNIKRECSFFKYADRVIVHSENMKKKLESVIHTHNFKILGPFDYLYTGKTIAGNWDGYLKLVIAGNLSRSKSEYVYKLAQEKNIFLNLYGLSYDGLQNERIKYHGAFPPEQLIENLQGNFGVVWDGSETTCCVGDTGNYLKYNSPHKFSLYIAAGLPVIIWKEAALANFVLKEKIGIVIDNLDELPVVLKQIDKNSYLVMLQNVLRIRESIINGKQLLNSINN